MVSREKLWRSMKRPFNSGCGGAGCQLYWIWDELRNTPPLGGSVRVLVRRINWGETPPSHTGRYLPHITQIYIIKRSGGGEENQSFCACLSLLLLVHASTLSHLSLPPSSFTDIRIQLFRLPTGTEGQWYSRNPPGLQYQVGTTQLPSLMGCPAILFSVFFSPQGAAYHCWITKHICCRPF